MNQPQIVRSKTHKNFYSSALLICNGEMPAKNIVKKLLARNPYIICADGGANAARTRAITPHTIIGDFDSISESTREYYLRHSSAEFIHLQRQSDTDFEKALKYLLTKKIPSVIVLGGTGKLTDHTLGNFSIMMRYTKRLGISFIDNHFQMEWIGRKISFDSRIGGRISLVPYPAASGITTRGLKYPLRNESLRLGMREGTCNEAAAKRVTIELKKGNLLLFREIKNV